MSFSYGAIQGRACHHSEAQLNFVLRFLNDAVRIQEGQHAALKAAVVESMN